VAKKKIGIIKMGITVPNCTLPNQISLNNVFMSFTGETVIIQKDLSGNAYSISSNYRIYKDSTRPGPVLIRCPIIVNGIDNIDTSPYKYLYDSLKQTYSGSVDEKI
jgi:hypothetical protein